MNILENRLLTERKTIRDVDQDILALLLERFEIVEQIGLFKKKNQMVIHSDSDITNNPMCVGISNNKKYQKHITEIYKEIIKQSIDIQKKI